MGVNSIHQGKMYCNCQLIPVFGNRSYVKSVFFASQRRSLIFAYPYLIAINDD